MAHITHKQRFKIKGLLWPWTLLFPGQMWRSWLTFLKSKNGPILSHPVCSDETKTDGKEVYYDFEFKCMQTG